jgi:hypothetical protein
MENLKDYFKVVEADGRWVLCKNELEKGDLHSFATGWDYFFTVVNSSDGRGIYSKDWYEKDVKDQNVSIIQYDVDDPELFLELI